MKKQLYPRHVEVRWKYRPRLEFYEHFNAVGLELEVAEFADWQRGDRTLNMVDRKRHRALRMANGEVVYEHHLKEASEDEVSAVIQLHDLIKRFGVDEYRQLSASFTFAIQVEHGFNAVVSKLSSRFFVSNERINAIYDAPVIDVGLAVDLQTDDGIESLQFGPMTKKEWFGRVSCDRFLFDGERSFTEFEATIPDDFVYFRAAYSSEKVPMTDVADKLTKAWKRVRSSTRSFTSYYQKG